jgi:hypothetical protein
MILAHNRWQINKKFFCNSLNAGKRLKEGLTTENSKVVVKIQDTFCTKEILSSGIPVESHYRGLQRRLIG